MKKRFWSFVLCLVVGLTFVKPELQAYEEKYRSAEEVFPEEEVQKLREEIAQEWGIDLKEESEDELSYSNWYPRRIRSRRPANFPLRKGVILVTDDAYKNLIPTGHAGIVYGRQWVVESLANGVTIQKDENWWGYKKRIFGVTVNDTTALGDEKAADWCYLQIGKPYNFNFKDTSRRWSFYCSHLIYAAYKDLYGIDLNTQVFGQAIHPLELVRNNKTHQIYYISD